MNTPGPWQWYTSNSHKRLGTKDEYSVLLYAVKYQDGVVGIEWRNPDDAKIIEAAPDLADALEIIISNWDAWMSEAPPEWVCACTRRSIDAARLTLKRAGR